MENIYINKNGNAIDLNKLRYDLAMIYVKHKFNEIELDDHIAPDYVECMDTLLEFFGNAYQELCNLDEDYFINKIDFSHECNSDD